MTQPTPTPVPDHGTGWGLLLLFVYLYGAVALLGIGTLGAIAIGQVGRRIPAALHYLLGAVLLGTLGLAGFVVLVAATAQLYDVVGLVVLIVFVPLTFVVHRGRGRAGTRLAIVTHAAMAWSLPFLVGFGVVAFVGTQGGVEGGAGGISPGVAGVVAVLIVLAGTIVLDRRVGPDAARTRE